MEVAENSLRPHQTACGIRTGKAVFTSNQAAVDDSAISRVEVDLPRGLESPRWGRRERGNDRRPAAEGRTSRTTCGRGRISGVRACSVLPLAHRFSNAPHKTFSVRRDEAKGACLAEVKIRSNDRSTPPSMQSDRRGVTRLRPAEIGAGPHRLCPGHLVERGPNPRLGFRRASRGGGTVVFPVGRRGGIAAAREN